jgi:rhodanese-related sulfurtransferase
VGSSDLSGKPYKLVDVRTPQEFKSGHIPTSISLPLDLINTSATKFLPNKDAEIIVYCQSGMRAKAACAQLMDMGYTNISLLGGIIQWPYEITKK